MIDWDAYRAAYPAMSYADVAAFHRLVWAAFPDQDYHSRPDLARFFDGRPAAVLEVGGWRGEAAAWVLAAHPEVSRWDNYEVCEAAAASPVTADPRYHASHPDRWPWEVAPYVPHDTLVLAHVAEHMNGAQLAALVAWAVANGVRRAFVEAPLIDTGRSWRRQTSAHVLELGWPAVAALFARHGLALVSRTELADSTVCIFEAVP